MGKDEIEAECSIKIPANAAGKTVGEGLFKEFPPAMDPWWIRLPGWETFRFETNFLSLLQFVFF